MRDDEDSISSVGSTDGTSWNNEWLDGVADSLKTLDDFVKDELLSEFVYRLMVSEQIGFLTHLNRHSGELHRGDSSNILANEPSGSDLLNAAEHERPEVAVVLRASSLPGITEGLAGKASCEDGDLPPPFAEICLCDVFIRFCFWEIIIKHAAPEWVNLAMEDILPSEHGGGNLRRTDSAKC